jgi:hypothetical protein
MTTPYASASSGARAMTRISERCWHEVVYCGQSL